MGELAVDVLLASCSPAGSSRVATLEHEDVLPCVGNDPLTMADPGSLSTVLELHVLPLAGGEVPGATGAPPPLKGESLDELCDPLLDTQSYCSTSLGFHGPKSNLTSMIHRRFQSVCTATKGSG